MRKHIRNRALEKARTRTFYFKNVRYTDYVVQDKADVNQQSEFSQPCVKLHVVCENVHTYTSCDQKTTVIFKFHESSMLYFRIMLVHMSATYFGLSKHNHKKVSRIFVCCQIFYYLEKMDQRNCIKFCVKMKLNVTRHLKCQLGHLATISRTQVQLWYNRFK